MIRRLRLLFKGWRWVDYLQFIHSIAFCFFGILILIRLGIKAPFLGYVVGFSFLCFGAYRIRMVVFHVNKTYQELKKNSLF